MQRELVLRVEGLSKGFPGVKALDNVSLSVERASVHAVVGENGAGKSTLMKVLSGLHAPDAGAIWLAGKSLKLKSPHDALKHGIAMIHQELLPFPDLTVAENIFMGQEPASRFLGWIDYAELNRKARVSLERLKIPIPPTRKMRELSVAEMQTVEIAKALAHKAEVIIMDEPTSAISAREVEALFEVIRDLKERGMAVIYISHKLDEIFRIADCVTVLRDGRHVATRAVGELNTETLIGLMVGRKLGVMAQQSAVQKSEAVLRAKDLSRTGKFQNVSFALRRGEVLGVGGLMGAGRTDLMHALYGLAPAEKGEMWVHGKRIRIRSPREAMAHGIALVSEDRKEYGLVLQMSVKHNLTLSNLRQYCRAMLVNHSQENRVSDHAIEKFSIKTSGRDEHVNHLSGGNQQKVVLAKALLTQPDILILDEPTRGIDIGSKAEIYKLIRLLAQQGKAILLVSSELPELLALSDRILVMREGSITAELEPARTTQEEILRFAMPMATPKPAKRL